MEENKPKVDDQFLLHFATLHEMMRITDVLIPDPYQPGAWLVKVAGDDIWSIYELIPGGRWVACDHQPGDLFHEW